MARTLVAVQEIQAPPGPMRIVAVVQDLQAGTLGAGMRSFRVPEEHPVLGELRLAAEDRGSVMLGWQQEAGEEEGRGRIAPLDALLPERALLREEKIVRPEAAAFLVYSLCDPAVNIDTRESATQEHVPVAFEGWTLSGILDCGAGHPAAMPTAPAIPRAEDGGSCALMVEPVPAWALSVPGDCRYQVTLERPGDEREVRELSFQVRD